MLSPLGDAGERVGEMGWMAGPKAVGLEAAGRFLGATTGFREASGTGGLDKLAGIKLCLDPCSSSMRLG